MLRVCVQTFDVTNTVENFLETKQDLIGSPPTVDRLVAVIQAPTGQAARMQRWLVFF